jgi:hypothetical protein
MPASKLPNQLIAFVLVRLLPTGGTSGQTIVKNSGTENDFSWATPAVTQAKLDEIEQRNWYL